MSIAMSLPVKAKEFFRALPHRLPHELEHIQFCDWKKMRMLQPKQKRIYISQNDIFMIIHVKQFDYNSDRKCNTLMSSSQYGSPSSSSSAKCKIVLFPDSTPYTSSRLNPISCAIFTCAVKPGKSSSSRASNSSD